MIKGWILHEIMSGKHHKIAKLTLDSIGTIEIIEIALKNRLREAIDLRFQINALPGFGNRAIVDVGRKNLDLEVIEAISEFFSQLYGDGKSFFTRGTARYPDA